MKRLFSFLLILSFLAPGLARADNPALTVAGKRAKIVGKAALYGLGGGLVVGVASQAFKKKAKNVFLFGSLGLYAGIGLGIYVITSSRGPAPYEGPDTYEDYGDFSKLEAPVTHTLAAARHEVIDGKLLEMNFLKLAF